MAPLLPAEGVPDPVEEGYRVVDQVLAAHQADIDTVPVAGGTGDDGLARLVREADFHPISTTVVANQAVGVPHDVVVALVACGAGHSTEGGIAHGVAGQHG